MLKRLLLLLLAVNLFFLVGNAKEITIYADGGMMNIPVVKQHPELPNGCEITSLTATLKYLGLNIGKMEMAKHYLPMKDFWVSNQKLYAPDPYEYFVGYPWQKNGWFCYAPPIVSAANNYFSKNGLSYHAVDYSKKTMADFEEALNNNNPIVIWVTREMTRVRRILKWHDPINGNIQTVPVNLHCVVLRGISGGKVHYMDPIHGNQVASVNIFFARYNELGSHAVMIETNSNPSLEAKNLPLRYDGSVIVAEGDTIQPLMSATFDKSNWFISLNYLSELLNASIEENEEEILLKNETLSIQFSKSSPTMNIDQEEKMLEAPLRLYREKYYTSLHEMEKHLNVLFLR